MTEQRRQTRIPAEFRAAGRTGRGEVRNVSQGGLFVGTLSIPDEGTEIEVTLTSPGKVPVEVKGLVWWTAPAGRAVPCGFGLRVLDDDEGYKRLVESLA
jgi:uncharacterized protein (TIGR02266 family)